MKAAATTEAVIAGTEVESFEADGTKIAVIALRCADGAEVEPLRIPYEHGLRGVATPMRDGARDLDAVGARALGDLAEGVDHTTVVGALRGAKLRVRHAEAGDGPRRVQAVAAVPGGRGKGGWAKIGPEGVRERSAPKRGAPKDPAGAARADGRLMAQQILVGGHGVADRAAGWEERTKAHMEGPHRNDWLDGVMQGVERQLALDGGAEALHPSKAAHLGTHLMKAAGADPWSMREVHGTTMVVHLARRSREGPAAAVQAAGVMDCLDAGVSMAGRHRAAYREAVAGALAAEGAGAEALDLLRTDQGERRGQAASAADVRLAGSLEEWGWEAAPGGREAAEAGQKAARSLQAAEEGQMDGGKPEGRPLEPFEAVAPGPARTQTVLGAVEKAARMGTAKGADAALGWYAGQAMGHGILLAGEGTPKGVEAIRRRDGTNLLHRLAEHPKAVGAVCSMLRHTMPDGAEVVARMMRRKDLAGRTPEEQVRKVLAREEARGKGQER